MIELVKREDGLWTWRWSEGEETFLSSKSYITQDAAEESATRAYPGAEVLVSGLLDASEASPGPAGAKAGSARKRRKSRRSDGRPPSRLVSLVVLVLAYLRSRSDSRSKGRRS